MANRRLGGPGTAARQEEMRHSAVEADREIAHARFKLMAARVRLQNNDTAGTRKALAEARKDFLTVVRPQQEGVVMAKRKALDAKLFKAVMSKKKRKKDPASPKKRGRQKVAVASRFKVEGRSSMTKTEARAKLKVTRDADVRRRILKAFPQLKSVKPG